MFKLSVKAILLSAIILVVSSLISGFFFSIGAELWQITKEGQLDLSVLLSPFWVISVPIGIIGVILLVLGLRQMSKEKLQEKLIDTRFVHLTIHFSQRKDTPEKPNRPYYLVDVKSKRAFWVPNYILALAKRGIIEWVTHDGEMALVKYLDDNGIELTPNFPSPEEIGLLNEMELAHLKPVSNLLLQGIKFYRTSDELPSLESLFSTAKVRINILAMDAGILLKVNYDVVKTTLTRDVIICFVLLDQNSKLLSDVGKAWCIDDANKSLQDSLSKLYRLKKELPEDSKHKLEIKFFNLLPIHSMIIIDPESENAQMQVTNYRYNTHSWTSLIFSKKEQPDLFKRYLQSYRFVEGKSREYQCPSTK